jgi:hypothetical protein
MRRASAVTIAEEGRAKRFTRQEFDKILRAAEFVAVASFWRALDRLARPETTTRIHGMGILCELARKAFADCDGLALSAQEAECFRFCGLMPLGVRLPGTIGRACQET